MERRTIILDENQARWLEEADVTLSELIRDAIDARMGPTDEDLAGAYVTNADEAARVTEEWAGTSRKANEYLGPNPNAE